MALFSTLRVEVRNTQAILERGSRRAELEADSSLRRLAQTPPREARWHLHLQARSTGGLDWACDIELDSFQFVPFRELLAAALTLRPKSGFVQHKQDVEAAESLIGRPPYPGKGPQGMSWAPPKVVHVTVLGAAGAIVPRVPFGSVSITCAGLEFVSQGPDSEVEAGRAIDEWLKRSATDSWTRHVAVASVILADGHRIHAILALHKSWGQTDLRRTLVYHLITRSTNHGLTESHRRLLAVLAQHLDEGTSFLAFHQPSPLGQFRCPCTARVPTRTASLAGMRILVPVLHASSGGLCRFVVDAYQDPDPVPTSATSEIGREVLDREIWWQGELKMQGLVST